MDDLLNDNEHIAGIINKDYGGIYSIHEIFYLHSILYSAERCLEAFQRYDIYKDKKSNPDYLVSIIQEAIGHSAALSRYFWPIPKGKKKNKNQILQKKLRGEKLRDFYNVSEDSVLFNRDLRNTWEHFDEKLDLFLLENFSGMFFPGCIVGSHNEADGVINKIFKLLDIDNECIVLLNKKFFFQPIKNEVERIFNITKASIESGVGFRYNSEKI